MLKKFGGKEKVRIFAAHLKQNGTQNRSDGQGIFPELFELLGKITR